MSDTDGKKIDLDQLARLARLSLSPAEMEKLGPQLERIVGYVEQLEEVDVTDVPAMAHSIPLENVFRSDDPAEPSSREEFLKNAPATRNGQIVVPKVIE